VAQHVDEQAHRRVDVGLGDRFGGRVAEPDVDTAVRLLVDVLRHLRPEALARS
jgi:allantoate deiminase